MSRDDSPSRRDFLSTALVSWAACAAAAGGAALVASAIPVPEPPAVARVPKSSLVDGVALASLRGAPVAVALTPDGPAALSLSCTHARCTVRWDSQEKRFLCPCHGGAFDVSGRVVKGPPPAPLRRLEIADAGDAWEIRG
jgi:Rieske Fe-S protein